MKGLFLKDMYGLLGLYKKNLILVAVLYGILSISVDMPFFFFMMIWMMGFYSLSAITLDQSCQWDRYARTLPVSAGQIVGGKFLVCLAFAGAGVLYSLLGGTAAIFIKGYGENWVGFYEAIVIILGLTLLSMGLMIPAAYKWGVDKARNTLMIVFALLFGGFFLVMGSDSIFRQNLPALDEAVGALKDLTEMDVWLGAGLFLLLGLVVFIGGWWVSCRLYNKKEF